MSTPWLTLIGIGEDGRDGLSVRARVALEAAKTVIGGKRHLALAAPLACTTMPWPSPIEAIVPELLALRGTPVAVLATGDPYHYGVGTMLSQHVTREEMQCFPQPSAFSLAAARLAWSLQGCVFVSLHGRDDVNLAPHLVPGARIIVLSWDETTPARVADMLCGGSLGHSRVIVLEAMGGNRERVREAQADAFALTDIDPLNTIAIECIGTSDTARVPCVLPDDAFEHDGQITKFGIRAVTLAALAPCDGELLWDVGAGSGSIAVEWLRATPRARAIAFEVRQDRAARIARNAAHHGVLLSVVLGQAQAVFPRQSAPDAIFVGGGASDKPLLETAIDALKPGGRLVANAVTLEAQAALTRWYESHGGELHLLQHAQAVPVGRFSGWKPAMPVMQWRWTKSA